MATATATPTVPTPTATPGIAEVTEEPSAGSQTSSSLSVNFPNDGTAAGEVALMFLSVDTTYSEGYPTITTPTGWNLIHSVGHDNQDEIAVYYRVLTGSETSTYAVILGTTAGSAYGWSAIVKVFSGVNTTTPIDPGASAGTFNYGETEVLTGNSTAFSTSQANDAVVLFAVTNFFSSDQTQTFTWPSGFTQIAELDEDALGQASIGAAWHIQSTSGTTGALTVDWSTSLGSSSPLWEVFSVGLQPATGGTPTPTPTPVCGPITLIGRPVVSRKWSSSLTVRCPANVQPGDFIGVWFVANDSFAPTPPSGYINVIDGGDLAGNNGVAFYYHIQQPGDSASVNFGYRETVSLSAICAVYSGVNTSNPIDNFGSQPNTVSTTIVSPSITTAIANDALLMLYNLNAKGAVSSPSLGTTERQETFGGEIMAWVDQPLTIPGATGNQSVQFPTVEDSFTAQIAIAPASCTTPTSTKAPTPGRDLSARGGEFTLDPCSELRGHQGRQGSQTLVHDKEHRQNHALWQCGRDRACCALERNRRGLPVHAWPQPDSPCDGRGVADRRRSLLRGDQRRFRQSQVSDGQRGGQGPPQGLTENGGAPAGTGAGRYLFADALVPRSADQHLGVLLHTASPFDIRRQIICLVP